MLEHRGEVARTVVLSGLVVSLALSVLVHPRDAGHPRRRRRAHRDAPGRRRRRPSRRRRSAGSGRREHLGGRRPVLVAPRARRSLPHGGRAREVRRARPPPGCGRCARFHDPGRAARPRPASTRSGPGYEVTKSIPLGENGWTVAVLVPPLISIERVFATRRRGARSGSRRGRPDHDPRRAGAQPPERLPGAAARQAHRLHRPVGLGQVVARLRHDLRRGPAPLRRVAVGLRPPVPRADGQARRRLHRGPVAGHLDRPEVGVAQPALDRRHDHRGLRLPPPAVRPHRRAARSRDRRGAGPPDAPADRRPHHAAARGHALPGAGAGGARPQGHLRAALRGPRQGGLRPGPGRRRGARARRPTTRSSSPATSCTRSRSSSTGSCCATASSAGSPSRWRPRCAWPRAWPRSSSCPKDAEPEVAHVLRAPGPPVATASRSRSSAPRNFSFNSPYGACAHCEGLGTVFEVDPELVVPNPDLSVAEGAIAPWSGGHAKYFHRLLESPCEQFDIPFTTPFEDLSKKRPEAPAPRRRRHQAGRGQVQEPLRPHPVLQRPLRGRHPVPPAPARRGRERQRRASRSRATCARCRAPRATAPGSSRYVAGRHRRRPQHLRVLRDAHRRGRASCSPHLELDRARRA